MTPDKQVIPACPESECLYETKIYAESAMIKPGPDKCELTIVMPCLNEAETLEVCIKKAQSAINEHRIDAEIVVSDNGSTDGSIDIAERLGARVVRCAEKGYGNALMAGIEAARGKYIIMGDADDSYDFSAIYPFVEKLREGNDLVMGCRLPWGGGKIMPGAMPWKHKWIGNPALTGIGKLFFNSPAKDFHCGLRGFTKEAYYQMELCTTGMEFASEMVIKATLRKMKIAEIPITLYQDGRTRPPHLRSWRDGWRHLRFMLLYSPNWLFLVPGMVFIILGLIGFLALLPGGLVIGKIYFDTNTLLVFSLALQFGIQLIIFGVFAKVFSSLAGLRPKDKFLDKFKIFTLETGVITGSVIFLIGVAFMIAAVFYWKVHGFGEISYPRSLRMVIPGVNFIGIGVQIVFSSFLLSVLHLKRKKTDK